MSNTSSYTAIDGFHIPPCEGTLKKSGGNVSSPLYLPLVLLMRFGLDNRQQLHFPLDKKAQDRCKIFDRTVTMSCAPNHVHCRQDRNKNYCLRKHIASSTRTMPARSFPSALEKGQAMGYRGYSVQQLNQIKFHCKILYFFVRGQIQTPELAVIPAPEMFFCSVLKCLKMNFKLFIKTTLKMPHPTLPSTSSFQ